MAFWVILLILFIILYARFLRMDWTNKIPKGYMVGINILFGVLLLPYAFSEVTEYGSNNQIKSLKEAIEISNTKQSQQEIALDGLRQNNEQLIRDQEIFRNEIRKKIIDGIEFECIKDLEERRENIKKLHNETFQISKAKYDTFVDELFDDIKKIQSKQKQLELEQIKQSDQSLVYFESLLMYVLNNFDTISDQLAERGKLDKTIKYEGNLREYIHGENSHYLVIRDYVLTKNINITITIANRYFKNGKLKRHPLIKIDAKDRPFRPELHHLFFHIKGPKVKELMPKGGTTGVRYTPLQHITYPIDEDPLLNKKIQKQIDAQIRKMFQIIYLPKN